MEVHGLRVLKSDGKVEDYPVLDGDIEQAKLRAALSQRPGDYLVVLTDHAYIKVSPAPSGAPAARDE